MLKEVIAIKETASFLCTQVPAREQPAESPPCRAIAWIGKDVGRAVGKDEAGAGMIGKRQLLLAPDEVGAHYASRLYWRSRCSHSGKPTAAMPAKNQGVRKPIYILPCRKVKYSLSAPSSGRSVLSKK
jgi:hypothetical protein